MRLSKNPDALPVQYGISDVKVLQGCTKRQKNGKSDARLEQQDDIDMVIDSELIEQE